MSLYFHPFTAHLPWPRWEVSGPLLSFACSAPVRWVGAPGSWQAGQRREFQLLGTSCGDRAGWEGAREREASRELLPARPRFLLREAGAHPGFLSPGHPPLPLSSPFTPHRPVHLGAFPPPFQPHPPCALSLLFPEPRACLRWRPRRVWPLGTGWPVACGLWQDSARWREREADFKSHPHARSDFAIPYEAYFPDPGRFHLCSFEFQPKRPSGSPFV